MRILTAKPLHAFRVPALSLPSSDTVVYFSRRLLAGNTKPMQHFAVEIQNAHYGLHSPSRQEPNMAKKVKEREVDA